MSHSSLSARQIYDTASLGSLIRFSDGTPEPPARHRRKRAAWASSNATGRLVRKAPGNHVSTPSFTLHVGDFGSGDVTVVKAYRVFTMSSPLSFAILERPQPGQAAVLQEENGIRTLIHLADTEEDAGSWLKSYPHRGASIVPVEAFESRTFTYLQDPGHGWLLVSRDDLASVGMSPTDFTVSSYVCVDNFALEEDCDMSRFLKRLDERGIPYRICEKHCNGDAYVRNWACNYSRPASTAAG